MPRALLLKAFRWGCFICWHWFFCIVLPFFPHFAPFFLLTFVSFLVWLSCVFRFGCEKWRLFALVAGGEGGSFAFYLFAFMHSYPFPHCFLHFVYSHSQGLIFIEHSYVFPHCFLHFVYSHSQGLIFIDWYACVALTLVFIVTFFCCFWVYKVSCERM